MLPDLEIVIRLKWKLIRLMENVFSGPSIPGPAGMPGAPGIDGQEGRSGLQGDRGEPGLPRSNAKGERGDVGLTGLIGSKGEKGFIGDEGPRGYPGPIGRKGPLGSLGPEGRPGPQGYPGLKVCLLQVKFKLVQFKRDKIRSVTSEFYFREEKEIMENQDLSISRWQEARLEILEILENQVRT